MKTVYIVIAIYGDEYENYSKIEGVYSSSKKADKALEEFKAEIERLQAIPEPEHDINFTEEQWQEYEAWEDLVDNANEYYDSFISKREVL